MGIIIRQGFYTSLITVLGIVIGYINLLYLYPRFLETEQIGLLRTIQDASILLAPFAQVGLAQTIIRFYPQFSSEPSRGIGFINFVLLLSLGGYLIFLVVFFSLQHNIISFFDENAPVIANYLFLILWLTFFLMVLSLLEFYSRALLKVTFPHFLREVGTRLFQGIIVTLYFLRVLTFDQFLMVSVFIYILTLTILLIYLIYHGHFKITFSLIRIPRKKLSEILTYALLGFIGTGALVIIGKLDSIMVTAMVGLTANAIYTTAFYIATVIEIPKRALSQTNATIISRAFERNDLGEISRIYQKTALNQLIIGALLLIGIWANLHNMFQLIPKGGVFQQGSYVVMLVGIAKLVDMAFGPNGEIIALSKFYWLNMVGLVVLALMSVTSNYLLIPVYGIEGAAYGTALSLAVYNFLKCGFVFANLRLQPFTFSFIKVILIIAVVCALNYLLPVLDHPILDIGFRSSILTIAYGGLILVTNSSEEIKKIVVNALSRVGLISK